MSAYFDEAITPCPSRLRSSGLGEHSGSETWESLIHGDDTFEPTGQIDFTTEIRAPILTGARPRRGNKAVSTFHIHEDAMNNPPGPVEKRRRPNGVARPSDRKSSLLAQPAQRFRPKVNFAPSPPSRSVRPETETRTRHSRSIPMINEQAPPVTRMSPAESKHLDHHNGLKKDVRRNTVYIPPDDTTVASVFMGLFSPLKKPHGELPQVVEDTQVNKLEARIANRQARKSLAVSARKAPLQPSAKIAQEAATRVDVAGKNGGKENIPPGAFLEIGKKKVEAVPLSRANRGSTLSTSKPVCRSTTHQPTKPSQSANQLTRPSIQKPENTHNKRNVLSNKQSSTKSLPPSVSHIKSGLEQPREPAKTSITLNARASALSERLGQSTTSRSSRTGHNSSKLKELNHEYPILTDDIARPALYEDNWLSHQETVISQLVNALFECTTGDLGTYDQDGLRLDLLGLYHTDYFIQLYKRLQASLACGNLSIPKDVLARNDRLRHDVGLRRKFVDVWVQSYDLRALVAALETVVGRKVCNETELFELGDGNSFNAKQQKLLVRKLEGFLEAFLLRNDDIDPSLVAGDTPAEIQAKSYRRTVLRSVLVVVLLDQGRQSLGTSLPRRLFAPSSSCKSSIEVLHALTRVLLPSCGDITKQLNHLGCHLSYKQHQLQEYDYQMNNIAVDLRDGVRLTRIVEVLFYTPEYAHNGDETVTLNTGEALSLLGDERDLPLSKHLKYPCASRAAKVFNVQIALSALSTVKGSGAIVNDIRAEDIVDGYREKTIALLWALVSKWGLAGLVDWDDVTKEIERLKRKALSQLEPEQIKDKPWFTGAEVRGTDKHAQMLQQWAALLAALKGLRINNMTTSFADGKIYESIVDEYEPYITGRTDQSSMETCKTSGSLPLESRLRLLGCSYQFAHLVSPGSASSHILDHDFTLGALAFLCSRLLCASKRARAATILQRVWRARLAERDNFRRTIAKNLATHCATVVQTRNEILWAKEVITRWWRENKARRERAGHSRSQAMRKSERQSRRTAGRRL